MTEKSRPKFFFIKKTYFSTQFQPKIPIKYLKKQCQTYTWPKKPKSTRAHLCFFNNFKCKKNNT